MNEKTVLEFFAIGILVLSLVGAISPVKPEIDITGYSTIRVINSSFPSETAYESEKSYLIDIITAEIPVKIQVENAVPIQEILIKTLEINKDVNINVKDISYDQKSALITDEIYGLFEIQSNELKDISSIEMIFKVNKAWIEKNNIDADKIFLNQFIAGSWVSVGTEKINESDGFVLFKAYTKRIGLFAITGIKKPKVQEIEVQPAPVEEETPIEEEPTIEKPVSGLQLSMIVINVLKFAVAPLILVFVVFFMYGYLSKELRRSTEVRDFKDMMLAKFNEYIMKQRVEQRKVEMLARYFFRLEKQGKSPKWLWASARVRSWPREHIKKALQLKDELKKEHKK